MGIELGFGFVFNSKSPLPGCLISASYYPDENIKTISLKTKSFISN
jgi:hypothetical protein